ncbi:MAG: SAM-dependent methyltransferase, partial [Verrucomicrobiota bacterium]|nr:SAM-dependent methyltransferase [Verrucomicrobiota bacterium]
CDYGFPRREFYSPQRTSGTLRAFARHRVSHSPLAAVGETDITAHVEWTSLAEAAKASGLDVIGFADQHHFITGLLSAALGAEFGPAASAKTRRALQTLLHPNFLGLSFQFLGLSKNVPASIVLDGFRFGGDARATLGLA